MYVYLRTVVSYGLWKTRWCYFPFLFSIFLVRNVLPVDCFPDKKGVDRFFSCKYEKVGDFKDTKCISKKDKQTDFRVPQKVIRLLLCTYTIWLSGKFSLYLYIYTGIINFQSILTRYLPFYVVYPVDFDWHLGRRSALAIHVK